MAVTLERSQNPAVSVPEAAEAAASAIRELVEGFRAKEARELAKRVSAKFPESRELRYWDCVLSPGGVGVGPRSRRFTATDIAWIKEHGEAYPQRWLALLNGTLLGVEDHRGTLEERVRELGVPLDDVYFLLVADP
jgi:hypothetical protein